MDVGAVVGGVGLSISIAKYLDLVGDPIEDLKQSQLESAQRMLHDALVSTSEQQSLLRAARDHLYQAVGLEQHWRRAVAYLGLAMCHRYLGDRSNCERALREILTVPGVGWKQRLQASAKDALRDPIGVRSLLREVGGPAPIPDPQGPAQRVLESSEQRLVELQDDVRAYLDWIDAMPSVR